MALNLFRQLVVYLAPVLPKLAEETGALVGGPIRAWGESQQVLLGLPVAPFKPLARRVEPVPELGRERALERGTARRALARLGKAQPEIGRAHV